MPCISTQSWWAACSRAFLSSFLAPGVSSQVSLRCSLLPFQAPPPGISPASSAGPASLSQCITSAKSPATRIEMSHLPRLISKKLPKANASTKPSGTIKHKVIRAIKPGAVIPSTGSPVFSHLCPDPKFPVKSSCSQIIPPGQPPFSISSHFHPVSQDSLPRPLSRILPLPNLLIR